MLHTPNNSSIPIPARYSGKDRYISWEVLRSRIKEYLAAVKREVSFKDFKVFFVRPAGPSTCTGKGLFTINDNIVSNILTTEYSFKVSSEYRKDKLIPFIPNLIKECDLDIIFTDEVYNKFIASEFESAEKFFKQMKALYGIDMPKAKKLTIDIEVYGSDNLIFMGSGEVLNTTGAATINQLKKRNPIKSNKEETKMSKNTQVANKIKNVNIEAVKMTTRIAAGKVLNASVQEKIVPKLPLMIKGYAATPLGGVLFANVAATALTYYAPDNEKAALVSRAMIEAAMVDLLTIVDLEGMVKEFLSSDAATRIVDTEKDAD